MIINRVTRVVKRGCMEEAIELVLAAGESSSPVRVSVSETGLSDTIAMEFEFENLSAYEGHWKEFYASPEYASFRERWHEITDVGGTNELWRRVK